MIDRNPFPFEQKLGMAALFVVFLLLGSYL